MQYHNHKTRVKHVKCASQFKLPQQWSPSRVKTGEISNLSQYYFSLTVVILIDSSHRQCATKKVPPHRLVGEHLGATLYRWFITEDEYLRLNKLFGRDFQETGLGGTTLYGPPVPCDGCGKYSELIDWFECLPLFNSFSS